MNALQAALIQRFAPQQKALQGNLAASNQRATKEVPAYFREYLAKLGTPNQKGSLAGQAVGGYQDAQSHLAGGNLSPGANIISNSFGALLNTLGANTGAYEADKNRIGRLQGIQAVQQERARGSNLRQSLSDLAAQKGAFAVTEKAAMDSAAQKNALDVTKLNAQLAHYGSMERTARSNSRTARYRAEHPSSSGSAALNAAKLAYLQAHGYLPGTGPPSKKGGGGYTPSKLQGFGEKWDSALALGKLMVAKKTYVDKATGKKLPITQETIYGALVGKGYAPSVAMGASFKAYGSDLQPETKHDLALRGIHP